jgi:O-antigen/teichoic acid export membrane protein
VGVVIFMATFIGAALVLQAWEKYQAEGWAGLTPILWAVLFGSVAGFAVESLDAALERRGQIASTVFRVVLGLAGLLIAIAGLAFVWESDAGLTIPLPVAAGIGLTRLTVWMWHRRSRTRPPAPVESDATWR